MSKRQRRQRRKRRRKTRRKYIRRQRKRRKTRRRRGGYCPECLSRLILHDIEIAKLKSQIENIKREKEIVTILAKQKKGGGLKWLHFKSKKKKKISPKKTRRGPLTPSSPPTTFARGPKTNKMINDNDSVTSIDTIWTIPDK